MTKKQQELKAVIDLVLNCQFETKRFSGDPLEWETFNDTFETAIEHNRNLTKIEKFTCLRGYLEGTALQAIDGFPLPNDNYSNAWNLLKERYGNLQLITSCHVNNFIELEAVSESNVKDSKLQEYMKTKLDRY